MKCKMLISESVRHYVQKRWETGLEKGFGLKNYGTDLSEGFPGCLRNPAVGTRMPITKITHTLVAS